MPTVSVIIITYNRANLIRDAIDSVFAQTYTDYELIVVDDGSEDHTRDIVATYGDRIKYFYQENQGMASARNRGIEEAKGEYIAFLDSDDIWFPQKLEKQVNVAKKTKVGLVHTSRFETDLLGRKPRFVCPLNPAKSSYDFLGGRTHISMTVLVKRDDLIRCGMFDETLKNSNDTDMWLRMAKHNVKFYFIDEVLMDVRIHTNNISRDMDAKYVSRMLIAEKMLKDFDPRISRSVWRRKLAENSFLFAIVKYKSRFYPECARLVVKALKNSLFAGWLIAYPKEPFLSKLKMSLSPYSLLFKALIKSRGKL